MSKTLSPKYYQENKERLQKKKTCERYYGLEHYKNLSEDENRSLLSREKNIMPFYNDKKHLF